MMDEGLATFLNDTFILKREELRDNVDFTGTCTHNFIHTVEKPMLVSLKFTILGEHLIFFMRTTNLASVKSDLRLCHLTSKTYNN